MEKNGEGFIPRRKLQLGFIRSGASASRARPSLAAAILVFALRVDRSRDYQAALDELRAMQDLNVTGWITFVRDRYNNYGSQNDKFVRDIVKLAGVPLQGNPSLQEPVFGDEIHAGTPLQLDAFVKANQKIGILELIGAKHVPAEQLK